MDFLLGAIIIVLFAYNIFKDILYHRHLSELENKFMSKDFTSYQVDKTPIAPEDKENTIAEKDNLVALDEVENPFIDKKSPLMGGVN